MGDWCRWLCHATEQATQSEACKTNAETPQKARSYMINGRFILKSGQSINHSVNDTIDRKIHEVILNKTPEVLQLTDSFGNVTMSLVVAEIAAYVNIT